MNETLNENGNEKVKEKFESFKNYDYTEEDVHNVLNNEGKINDKAKKGPLAKYSEYISLFFEMLQDTFSGKYKSIPKGSIAAMICSLLYVFSPIDLIPDFIPVLGLLDDAAIIALCIKFVSLDIDKYKEWKKTAEKIEKEYSEESK